MEKEIEDIKQRLAVLEAQMSLNKDMRETQQILLFALLRVAHKRDPSLPAEWLAEVRSRNAFAQAAFGQIPPQTLEVTVAAFQGLLDALTKDRRSR